MNEETRIPLEAFADFNSCRLLGSGGSIRWSTAMEAFEEERKHQLKWHQDNRIISLHQMFNLSEREKLNTLITA